MVPFTSLVGPTTNPIMMVEYVRFLAFLGESAKSSHPNALPWQTQPLTMQVRSY